MEPLGGQAPSPYVQLGKLLWIPSVAGVIWKIDPPLKMEPESIFNVEYGTRKPLNLDEKPTLHGEY